MQLQLSHLSTGAHLRPVRTHGHRDISGQQQQQHSIGAWQPWQKYSGDAIPDTPAYVVLQACIIIIIVIIVVIIIVISCCCFLFIFKFVVILIIITILVSICYDLYLYIISL